MSHFPENPYDQIQAQRKQIEALTAQVGVLREALDYFVQFNSSDNVIEVFLETSEIAKARRALATTPESALSEVRKAEREKCAALCEKSDRYRGDYFAAKIRAMGDE